MCLKHLGKRVILVVSQGKMQPNFALVILSSFRVVIDGLQGSVPWKEKGKGERISGKRNP